MKLRTAFILAVLTGWLSIGAFAEEPSNTSIFTDSPDTTAFVPIGIMPIGTISPMACLTIDLAGVVREYGEDATIVILFPDGTETALSVIDIIKKGCLVEITQRDMP